MTKAMKTVRAAMTWKGRKLLCNGVCVAEIQDLTFLSPPRFNVFPEAVLGREMRSEKAIRRAVNRRFGLPLDFGGKK